MADVTRDQGAEIRQNQMVLGKIFQNDRTVPDAELTEIGQLGQYLTSRMLANLVNHQNTRFGSGWDVTGGTNQVTIALGDAALLWDSDHAFIVSKGANHNLTFTTPNSGTRTDYVYVDLEIVEVDSTTDSTLINSAVSPDPDYGQETAIDRRLAYSFAKTQGTSVPAAPAGHTYVTLASISRTAGVDAIADGDITENLVVYPFGVPDSLLLESYLKADGTRQLDDDMAVATGKTIDGADISEFGRTIFAQSYNPGHYAGGSAPQFDLWQGSDENDLTGTWHLPSGGSPSMWTAYHGVWAAWKQKNDKYLVVDWEIISVVGGQLLYEFRIYMGPDLSNNVAFSQHLTLGAWTPMQAVFNISNDVDFPVGCDLTVRWRSTTQAYRDAYVRKFKIYTLQHV
jgi:hypothetical protein